MKQISSILLAFAFLFSSTGFTISAHHCGGKVHKQSIYLVAEDLSCGMELAEKVPCEDNTVSSNCCQNEFQTLKITDSFLPQTEFSQLEASFIIAFTTTYINLFTVENNTYNKYINYTPPLPDKDIPVLVQSFLI